MVRSQPKHHSVHIDSQTLDDKLESTANLRRHQADRLSSMARESGSITAVVAYSGGVCHMSYNEAHHSGIARITRCPTVNGVPEAEEQYAQEANSSYSTLGSPWRSKKR